MLPQESGQEGDSDVNGSPFSPAGAPYIRALLRLFAQSHPKPNGPISFQTPVFEKVQLSLIFPHRDEGVSTGQRRLSVSKPPPPSPAKIQPWLKEKEGSCCSRGLSLHSPGGSRGRACGDELGPLRAGDLAGTGDRGKRRVLASRRASVPALSHLLARASRALGEGRKGGGSALHVLHHLPLWGANGGYL